jgi:hypothetical protein
VLQPARSTTAPCKSLSVMLQRSGRIRCASDSRRWVARTRRGAAPRA